jgi:hypothetical protein
MFSMNKEHFASLCDQVLIPRLDTLLNSKLADVHDTLDIMAAELARIETKTVGQEPTAPAS